MARYTLEQLKEQETRLRERIRDLADAERKQQKKNDARKQSLLGALMLAWLKDDKGLRDRVEQALPEFLKRDIDKALFRDECGSFTIH